MEKYDKKSQIGSYAKRIQRHKKQKIVLIIAAVIVLILVSVFLVNSYINRVFNSCKVTATIKSGGSGEVQYLNYGDGILKVSKDGVNVYSTDGELKYSGSYDMRSPQVDICDKYIAVADIGSYDVYVFDGENPGAHYKMERPILQIQVANQGMFAVLLEEDDASRIQFFSNGEELNNQLVDSQINVNKGGFPVNIALSDDGKKLVTSYIQIKNGVLESNVTFYSYSDVGQNHTDNMVGSKNYGTSIVSKVEFLNNNTVCVYTDTGFELFKMNEKKESIAKEKYNNTIRSVFSNDEYFGFLLNTSGAEGSYELLVYDVSGKRKLKKEIKYKYNDVHIAGDEIIFTSEYEMYIVKVNGVEKFSYKFNTPIQGVIGVSGSEKYFLMNDSTVDIIKLTEE